MFIFYSSTSHRHSIDNIKYLTNLSILYNNSPETVKYTMVLEEKGVGAEIVRNCLLF